MLNSDNTRAIGIGVLAGIAAAVMWAGAVTANGLAIVLFLVAPLPVIAVGLGWGTAAAAVAAGVSILAVGVFITPMSALVIALTNSLPSVVAVHLAGLARPAEEMGGRSGQIIWYPLADILFRLALMIAGAFIIIGIATGYGPQFGTEFAAEMTRALKLADPEFAPGPEFEPRLAAFLTNFLPAVQPAIFLIVFCGNLYLGLALVRISGRLSRPRDDWPLALRMPRPALVAFAMGLGLSFLSGGIGHIGAVISGAMGGGFLLAGLALFHYRTRRKAWRTVLLWLAYIGIALFTFFVFFFIIAGMFDSSRSAPVSSSHET